MVNTPERCKALLHTHQAHIGMPLACHVHVQVKDMVSFKHRSNVVMAYGSSGAGKTFSIEVGVHVSW